MSASAVAAVPGAVRHWLAEVARELAARGATGRSALAHAGAALLREVAVVLGPYVRQPDPDVGYIAVRDLLDAGRLGPTPAHWIVVDDPESHGVDVQLVLAAAVLGTPFGWTGQQGGRIVNNVLPSRGQEYRQVGASSSAELVWHTEDAFHPHRADLLLLACMRNPDGVGSRLANVRHCRLPEADLDVLCRPLWRIAPDESYGALQPDRELAGTAAVVRGAEGLRLRYDPSYSQPLTADPAPEQAYRRLGAELDRCAMVIDLAPGDLLIVDNNVVAHSRAPFRARYDGTDRWLKRVQVRTSRRRAATEPGVGFAALSQVDAPLTLADV